MAGLIPFNRRNDLSVNRFFNMMDDFFNDALPSERFFMNDTFKVDVKEEENIYTIEAEMPGVKKDEISIELDEGRLTISVIRNEQVEDNKENYIHKERRYSSMQRSIYLSDADEEGIDAKLDNGILSISIPKKTKTNNTKKIEIK